MKVTKDQALALYRMLQTIRQSEEGLARQYAAGFIHGCIAAGISRAPSGRRCSLIRATDS